MIIMPPPPLAATLSDVQSLTPDCTAWGIPVGLSKLIGLNISSLTTYPSKNPSVLATTYTQIVSLYVQVNM